MTGLLLNDEILNYLVLGGSFYGGGGGGSPEAGRAAGLTALRMGRPHLVDLHDLPDDGLLLTVSAVGAPAGEGPHASPADYVKAAQLFAHFTGKEVSGFIANECGGLATVNGWVQSAATGIPVVDAPCNGRAHPTGAMGSMGLHKVDGYISEQVAVSGRADDGSNLELFIRGSVEGAPGIVRKAASQVGGLVAVARNPVTVAYARANAAPGAIRRCLEVGRALSMRASSAEAAIEGAAAAAGGRVAVKGRVVDYHTESVGGFDLGSMVVEGVGGEVRGGVGREVFGGVGGGVSRGAGGGVSRGAGEGASRGAGERASRGDGERASRGAGGHRTAVYLYFCNEYLTMEDVGDDGGSGGAGGSMGAGGTVGSMGVGDADSSRGARGRRLSTFPDLITTLDLSTGLPVTSAAVRDGQEVAVVVVPAKNLILGAGVRDTALYAAVETITGQELVKYAFGGGQL